MSHTPRSRIYRGSLRHRRFLPRHHAFTYRVWMAWLDLDELPQLFDGVPGFSARRPALARFRREDYLKDDLKDDLKDELAPDDRPLKQAVREELERQLGWAPDGRICLLTQLRTLGVGINPISLYYAFDAAGELRAVLGEVTNVPWGERATPARWSPLATSTRRPSTRRCTSRPSTPWTWSTAGASTLRKSAC